MKIQVRDVVSYMGQDYVVEGVASWTVGGKTHPLARAVDGETVLWVEPLLDDTDDRLLVLREVKDLVMAVPPPQSISYQNLTYVQRWGGPATLQIAGSVPNRTPGPHQLWRYRAAGDRILQFDEEAGRVHTLAGESVHQGMIDILPGR
jgi:Domain of unknown function (DUF4178)